jgi:hypothetical protein
MAVSAAKFQSVTGFQGPVTAEAAGSSPVVPAIPFSSLVLAVYLSHAICELGFHEHQRLLEVVPDRVAVSTVVHAAKLAQVPIRFQTLLVAQNWL